MFGWNNSEIRIFKKLNTPAKIQDFLNKIPINFERGGDTCFSPRMVLKKQRAHCMEGAMFAAASLRFHGYRPLVVDLKATEKDFDHVIAVFHIKGFLGAISKTNHAVLRYREPIYKNIRELVMSLFHEYFMNNGKKTLRSYSMPVDLSRFDKKNWMISEKNIWYIPEYLDDVPHKKILTPQQIGRLRRADPIEIRAGKLIDWKL